MSWIRRGTPEWRVPTTDDSDNSGEVWAVRPGSAPWLWAYDEVAANLDDFEAWMPKPVVEPPPYTPPEQEKRREWCER